MILDPVTTRWAEALYEIAKKADAVDAIQKDTERLSMEVAPAKVSAFLFGIGVSQADREAKMAPLMGELHETTQKFVKLLFARRRQEVLRDIGEAFKRKVYAETGRIEGVVETPRTLDDETLRSLESAVGQRIGKTVVLTQESKPELIGGVRIIVGARLFDATVQGRLQAMRERLLGAALPS